MKKYNRQTAKERGSRLKEEIRNRGLTQGEVAESLDMSLSGLTYLLSGRSQINRTMAFALEFKFNIGSDWILEGKGLRRPQVFLRLDPWERMIIERNDKNFEKHNLDLILRGFEQDERNNQMLTYTSFAYIEGEISLDEKSEIDRKLGVSLDEHQRNRRNFFEHLFHGIPMEVKDSEKDSVISQRIRKIWRNVRPKDSGVILNRVSGLVVLVVGFIAFMLCVVFGCVFLGVFLGGVGGVVGGGGGGGGCGGGCGGGGGWGGGGG